MLGGCIRATALQAGSGAHDFGDLPGAVGPCASSRTPLHACRRALSTHVSLKEPGMWNRVLSKLRRDAGLSVVLALQAAIMFIVGPLAATGYVPPVALDAFRFGLAAAAVLMLTRSRLSALIIGVTFTASLILSFSLRSGGYETPVYVVRLIVTSAFDLAIGVAVARLAFGPGRVGLHRIMGGVILYLSIGLLFANGYRAAALFPPSLFRGTCRR